MRMTITAIGRMKPGAEKSMVDDYLARATKTGRSLALGPFDVVEIDDRKARDRDIQSTKLLEATGTDLVVALDERGKTLSSPELANLIARKRDEGCSSATFLIGGADGHHDCVRERSDLMLSFGKMVWPHMLVRVMLAEQLYRATSILSGGPYHRA